MIFCAAVSHRHRKYIVADNIGIVAIGIPIPDHGKVAGTVAAIDHTAVNSETARTADRGRDPVFCKIQTAAGHGEYSGCTMVKTAVNITCSASHRPCRQNLHFVSGKFIITVGGNESVIRSDTAARNITVSVCSIGRLNKNGIICDGEIRLVEIGDGLCRCH